MNELQTMKIRLLATSAFSLFFPAIGRLDRFIGSAESTITLDVNHCIGKLRQCCYGHRYRREIFGVVVEFDGDREVLIFGDVQV